MNKKMTKKELKEEKVEKMQAEAGMISEGKAEVEMEAAEASNETEVEVMTEPNEMEKWQLEAVKFQEQASRALADYQNLVRRQKEDQSKMAQVARMMIFASLLEPLRNLAFAAKSLDDQGLNMVIEQFWQVLGEQGLKEIKPMGEKFDPKTMEAVEKLGEGEIVQEVLTPGYSLGEQVLQVAKVKVG